MGWARSRVSILSCVGISEDWRSRGLSAYHVGSGRACLKLGTSSTCNHGLAELGTAMGEEIQRHDVIIDEVNAKMDTITSDLKTNNMRLKGLITKVRREPARG